MYCSDIVTKDKIKAFLNNILINKSRLVAFSNILDLFMAADPSNESDTIYQNFKKILFFSYNEYINYAGLTTDGSAADITNLIPSDLKDVTIGYGYCRDRFVRDYISTAKIETYGSKDARDLQLKIIDKSLTDADKLFLTEHNFYCNITSSENEYARYFTRIDDIKNGNYIPVDLSPIECDKLPDAAEILNRSSDDEDYIKLKSILKKIQTGTIH